MANDNINLNKILFTIIGLAIIAFVILVLVIIFNLIPLSSIFPTSAVGNDFLYIAPTTLVSSVRDITSVKVYNTTWLNCSIDDSITLVVNQSKATVSLWFNNETTDWTSIIKTGDDTYINGALDNTWTFFPYFILADDITLCKSDGSNFLNVSVDEFRIYESALNITDVTTVFNEGR